MSAIGTRSLVISIGATDFTAQVSKAVITSADSDADFQTFADVANGGLRDYQLNFVAYQDPTTGTLWDKVFSATGTTVACLLKPYGNAVASATQPHFSFSAVISEPDGDFLGGEADPSSSARMTFECKWDLTARPTRVTS